MEDVIIINKKNEKKLNEVAELLKNSTTNPKKQGFGEIYLLSLFFALNSRINYAGSKKQNIIVASIYIIL